MRTVAVVIAGGFAAACASDTPAAPFVHLEEAERGINDLSAFTPSELPAPDRVLLGKLLFFDERLSGDGSMSCATCHDPNKGYSDGRPTALGHRGKVLARNTPTIINLETRRPFFWDGRATTIEEQALGPLLNPDEMAAKLEDVLAEIESIPEYVARFQAAYGSDGITKDTLANAIGAFERAILSVDAPFDRHMKGDASALSPQAKQGLDLFVGKALCVRCHFGPQLTDNSFSNIGLPGTDEGRAKIVKVEPATGFPAVMGGFKTPGLRDIAKSAPYFHDGSAATLEAVVEHYAEKGDKIASKNGVAIQRVGSSTMPEISLTAEEKAAIVTFMREGLSGTLTIVSAPELPGQPDPRHPPRSLDAARDELDRQLRAVATAIKRGDPSALKPAIGKASDALLALDVAITKGRRDLETRAMIGNALIACRALSDAATASDRAAIAKAFARLRSEAKRIDR
ncbi:MAG: cytochrome-c peroxidase [Kofleriaceae bacterium]